MALGFVIESASFAGCGRCARILEPFGGLCESLHTVSNTLIRWTAESSLPDAPTDLEVPAPRYAPHTRWELSAAAIHRPYTSHREAIHVKDITSASCAVPAERRPQVWRRPRGGTSGYASEPPTWRSPSSSAADRSRCARRLESTARLAPRSTSSTNTSRGTSRVTPVKFQIAFSPLSTSK